MNTALAPAAAPPMAEIPSAPPTHALSGSVKAAIIVRLALAQGIKLDLSALPSHLQAQLLHQMTGLKRVDDRLVRQVAADFAEQFESSGLNFPGALPDALDLMRGALSPALVNQISKQAGISLHRNPWARIAEVEPDELLPVLEAESIEVSAVVLSKLETTQAAEMLGRMPGARARRVAYAMSRTGTVTPAIVERIGQSIAENFDDAPVEAFDTGPVERVGEILNFATASTRDEVLDGLDQDDSEFASQVRKTIFTFADIAERIEQVDVPKIARELEQEVLISALAGATGKAEASRDFIFSNMSKRMAEQLQDEIRELGPVAEDAAESAMTEVVMAIRRLESSGEIKLRLKEEGP